MAYFKYRIAELNVELNLYGERVKRQAEPYIFEFDGKADIVIDIKKEFIEQYHERHRELSFDNCEYIIIGYYFYKAVLDFDGFLIHSSAVVYENRAYLFTAPSGTGKSTHTALWLKNLKGSYILNDDKPLIRIIDGEVLAFGTPFSGKNDINVNIGVPLAAVTYITRGNENCIFKVNMPQAINILLWQTVRTKNKDVAEKTLNMIDRILRRIPVYEMSCDMSQSAFTASYEKLTGKKF